MLSHDIYLLVSCLITFATAIRVDWNTNTGPIIPPTPRTTQRPQPPFREPAPVWEDQSRDIPNPNPYVYVLPPPSRPRPATNNYLTADGPITNYNNFYNNNNNNNQNYGSLISTNELTAYQTKGQNTIVASLSPKYIPNVGYKYYAVIPNNNGKYTKYATAATNGAGNYYGYNDKVQGKFNAKTKKYKAYQQKVKYVPANYYPVNEYALPSVQQPVQFNQQQLMTTQQLPLAQAPQPFRSQLPTSVAPKIQNLPQQQQIQQQSQQTSKSYYFKDVYDKSNYAKKNHNNKLKSKAFYNKNHS